MAPYECRMKFRIRFRGSRLRPPRDSILRGRGLIERGWLLRADSTCVAVLEDSGRCVVERESDGEIVLLVDTFGLLIVGMLTFFIDTGDGVK